MAEAKMKRTARMDVTIQLGSVLPEITSTPEERLQALKDAREILSSTSGSVAGALFGSNKGGSQYADPLPLFRVADYITTGHDYFDTHPDIEGSDDAELNDDKDDTNE